MQMTTGASIGSNSTTVPTSKTFDASLLRNPSSLVLKNVLFTEFKNHELDQNGLIDLDFKLTFDSQSISQTATFEWRTYNNNGPRGATGAYADITQITPMVFNLSFGSVHLIDATSYTLMLGSTVGATEYGDLRFFQSYFVAVPEPSAFTVLGMAAIAAIPSRRRKSVPHGN